MHKYLERTQFATKTLIDAIFQEERELARLTPRVAPAQRYAKTLDRAAAFALRDIDDDEGIGQLKAVEAWDARVEANSLVESVEELTRARADKEQAIIALCGALLQVAKNGITVLDAEGNGVIVSPLKGRQIDGLHLEEIVWGGRNQSMHYQELPKHKLTKRVCDTLAATRPQFKAAAGKDLSREFISLLGWTDIEKYTEDMESILPPVGV
ncbi:MAG: hypothetical protein K8U57_28370 [Planctomycetes bacterium]|nr:hypothetical protein [Planctomycetota bacterium]